MFVRRRRVVSGLVGAHDQRASIGKQDRRRVVHAPDIGFGQDGELASRSSLGIVAEDIYGIVTEVLIKLITLNCLPIYTVIQ